MTRVLGWVLLLAGGAAALPLAAWFLDGRGGENWILPVQLVLTLLLGGVLGLALPGFVTGSPGRRFAVGAAYGLVAAAVGLVVFFLLISGLDGA